MAKNLDIEKISESISILPRLLHVLLSSFKPDFNVPIKKNELRTIIEIYNNPNRTMKYYINSVDIESGSFTYLTDKLVKKNIIVKNILNEDKRKTTLELSEFGTSIAQELLHQISEHFSNKLNKLNEEDLIELEKALRILDKTYQKIK